MPDTSDVKYFVLADRAVPYLLARVRWPDVAQAISAARPDWLDDPGLFDLPYDPSVVTVSFPQAVVSGGGMGQATPRRASRERAVVHPTYAGNLVRSVALGAAHVGHRVRREAAGAGSSHASSATAASQDRGLIRRRLGEWADRCARETRRPWRGRRCTGCHRP